MRKTLVTAAAFALLAASAAGAVRITAEDARAVCLPPAVIQAWS
ncbi:MAG: hypothetical protein ABR570_07820 [Burkholderiales bacterium]